MVYGASGAYSLHIATFEWALLLIYAAEVLNRTVEHEGADLETAVGMLAD